MTGYHLEIDEEKCWGCKTCEAACKQENKAPYGMKLIEVLEDGPFRNDGGDLSFNFRVRRCLQCEEPACAEVCPTSAIVKRPDAIVVLNRELCEECGLCLDACPFGAISLYPDGGAARKCDLCAHRIDAGLLPACADNVCLAHAINLVRITD